MEARGQRLEAGGWRLKARGWRLVARGWRYRSRDEWTKSPYVYFIGQEAGGQNP